MTGVQTCALPILLEKSNVYIVILIVLWYNIWDMSFKEGVGLISKLLLSEIVLITPIILLIVLIIIDKYKLNKLMKKLEYERENTKNMEFILKKILERHKES